MLPTPPPQPTPLPTPQLWERLRALFGRIIAAIGAPATIAALTLVPRMRTAFRHQLALVEIMARKLLLADAAGMSAPLNQRGPRLVEITLNASGLYTLPQSRRLRTPSPARAFDPTNPESWPVRFALAIPRDARIVQDRRAPRIRALWGNAPPPPPAPPRAPRRRHSDAVLLARRAEALRRMLNDPAPHARRLAHSRRIGVARSRDTIKRYAFSAPRRFIGDRHDPRLSVDILSAAIRAHATLTDTS